MRVTYQELYDTLLRVLATTGLQPQRASLCARLIADASRDGVASHGLNLFPRFIAMVRAGVIDVTACAEPVAAHGAVERWDGRRGPGNLNAYACMDRAIAIARAHGIGCVALRNTNHWMRGGSYGWQAADAGAIGLCWTNTMPNLPPWGASDPRIGNNPFVVGIPRTGGHVVLDMAMSQFSFGKLASYRRAGEELPVAGGFDEAGALTRDAAAIERSKRPLPIGFWKGSGLAIVLDMIAAWLSEGRATHQVANTPESEAGLSQVFIAIDASFGDGRDRAATIVEDIVDHLHSSAREGEDVRYPGERTLETRKRNLREGIPVDPAIWEFVVRSAGKRE